MGRMTKYLKQTAVVEHHVRNEDGTAKLDAYGQPEFHAPITVRCRKEPYQARATTSYGTFVNYTNTYYFDETVKVRNGDKVDGHEIQSVEEYIDGLGKLVGYRVDV